MSEISIPFNMPAILGSEFESQGRVFKNNKFSGDGPFTKECEAYLRESLKTSKALLVNSCTSALEMMALLLDIQAGDEVIMPSFTFVSTANAFALRGAKIKFVDIEPETMNLDINEVEKALNPKVKAVVVIHYGGVACDMDRLLKLSKEHGFILIEDAAQAFGAKYKEEPLGSLGPLSAFSFHETKNIHCGEGGALIVNEQDFILKAEMMREKGTNRLQFLRGDVDKYTWQSLGSSYLMSEFQAAFLLEQLRQSELITKKRQNLAQRYRDNLKNLVDEGKVEVQKIPQWSTSNGHLFYLKLPSLELREKLKDFLKERNIQTSSHYEPLHSSPAGKKFGQFVGLDQFTTKHSERLLRLPMFYSLSEKQVDLVCENIYEFIKSL